MFFFFLSVETFFPLPALVLGTTTELTGVAFGVTRSSTLVPAPASLEEEYEEGEEGPELEKPRRP